MTLLVSLFGCGHNQKIPNVAVYRELPFGPGEDEALEVWTLKDDYRIVEPEEWARIRPYMLMIPPQTWSEIKKGWLSACRIAGPNCTHEVESVDKFVKHLDDIVKGFVENR